MSSAPRTARGRRTREKILASALKEFGKVGYHDASIVRITEGAGVAMGTFYLYFDGKLAVFNELVEDLNRRLRHRLTQAIVGAPDRLAAERAGFRAFFEFTTEVPQLYRIIRQAEFVSPEAMHLHYGRIVEGYQRALAAASDAGEIAPLDPEVTAWALMGIGEIIGMRWILWQEGEDGAPAIPDDVLDNTLDFITRALRPDKE
ncbi:TetR/AcrR family transcriptional regulator [Propioniciclava sp. MC1595]|uniref:TetR/AcrR family transcriptional regulator n=1 Tax=Propioniciclava sp. MC1595 TaxID=2760308 RepID=UPI00166289FD|nr:TetR/AcrR family transcriptional regulator [Propioniciclava sp. MC1595]MBB1495540.1 TetR/AcrR family transcriptional regulator [Propioniciclava sp. MC1595]QTE25662.1 TetR/AcrR family transcriptional regulator [Propioniciclava sp. MC1595]